MEIEKKKKIIAVAVVLILIVILSVFFWLSDSSEKPSENSDKISEVEIKPEEKTDEETIENTENSNLTEEPSEEPAKDSEEPVEEAEKPEEESETDKEEEEKIDEVIETENERVAEVDDQTQSGSVEQTESKEPSGTQEQTGAQEPSAGADTDKEKDDSSSSNTPDIPVREPESDAQIANGKITCDAFGRYSGQYVEDGRDEPIESVATILVTNQSDEYLEYATLTFDIDGNAGNFIVTGLPPGASAWVMDASRLVIESGAAFTYLECVSSFRDDVNTSSEKINLTADGNMMSATNLSDETLEEVVVYYRVKHTDGNYLGGVTYTANFGTLEPGASIEVLAGHYSAANSEVVRVSWKD